MKKFDDWSEAEDWAKETNRYLEPIGTCTGDERTVRSWGNATTKVEIISRYAEVLAIGERSEVLLNIKEYVVATMWSDGGTWDTVDLFHADDLQDAKSYFDYEVAEQKLKA